MKNITGTRGAGSITTAQFLKRFVGNTSWAHLDIAGVTWSKKELVCASWGNWFWCEIIRRIYKNYYER